MKTACLLKYEVSLQRTGNAGSLNSEFCAVSLRTFRNSRQAALMSLCWESI
jgi:hypothetical protein